MLAPKRRASHKQSVEGPLGGTGSGFRLGITFHPGREIDVHPSRTPHGQPTMLFDNATPRSPRIAFEACLSDAPPCHFGTGKKIAARHRRSCDGNDDGRSRQISREILHDRFSSKTPGSHLECARACVRAVSTRAHMPSQSLISLN